MMASASNARMADRVAAVTGICLMAIWMVSLYFPCHTSPKLPFAKKSGKSAQEVSQQSLAHLSDLLDGLYVLLL